MLHLRLLLATLLAAATVTAATAVSGSHVADGPETMEPAKMLKDVRRPVLDIYGGAEFPKC